MLCLTSLMTHAALSGKQTFITQVRIHHLSPSIESQMFVVQCRTHTELFHGHCTSQPVLAGTLSYKLEHFAKANFQTKEKTLETSSDVTYSVSVPQHRLHNATYNMKYVIQKGSHENRILSNY